MHLHTTEDIWTQPLKTWKLEDIVNAIIELQDQSRFDSQGGYPSDYIIRGSVVYQATVDYNEKPQLVVQGIDEFIEDNDYWLGVIEEEIEAHRVPAPKVGVKNE